MASAWPARLLSAVERHLRHPARAHAGARQAGGGAGAARAAAPARGAAPDRARLGDGSAAGARRLGRARRRARPAHARGGGRAQRRARAARRARARPAGRRGHARGARGASRALGGAVEIDPTPQEVSWSVPLDEDEEHARYDPAQVAAYFAAATRAALVLAAFRAPYRGRSTPVNAWWGSFDLAVSLFSGTARRSALARLHHAQRDGRPGGRGRLVARRRALRAGGLLRLRPSRRPTAFAAATLAPPPARWEASLGEYILDWDDVRAAADPHAVALEFARSVFRHACAVCEWDPALAASADAVPPPGRLARLRKRVAVPRAAQASALTFRAADG